MTLWGSWSGDQVAQLKQLLQTYNDAHPGTTVTYKQQEVVEEKLLTAIAGGQVPDVVLWDRFTTNVYAPKGALDPIDDRLGDVDLGAFYPEAVEELRVDDQLYGLPLLVDCRALFYNKAFFAEAGLNPPTTWQELADTASALTVRTGGKLERAGFSLDDPGLFSTWLGQAVHLYGPGDSAGSLYPNWVTCAWPPDYGKILDYQWNEVLIPYFIHTRKLVDH